MAPNVSTIAEGLSEKEADQLAKHFKDPEFCRLFEDYAREMQDPKARAEQDAYLAQLEAQGELEGIYGQGVQVIQPEPGLVVKTKTADGKTRVYINVCTCSKVDEMVIQRTQGERAGANITLPNMLGIKGNREGKAPDGVAFRVWDFIVHPASLLRCTGNPALTEFLVSTAIEKLEEATQVKLLRKHKMLGVQYKGVDGEQRPPTLLLRTAGQGDVVDGRLRPLGQPGTAAAAAAAGAVKQSDTAQGRDAAQHTTGSAGRSSFSFKPKEKLSQNAPNAEATIIKAPTDVCTPQYQVVERARADLGTTWSDAGRGLKMSIVPAALIVRVDLPGVSSVAGVVLSLTAGSVSLEVPGKYQLHLPVRYKINEQQASAKFLTNKQQLVLTLPVAAPPAEQASQQQHGQQLVQEVEQEVKDVEQPEQVAASRQQHAQAQDVRQPAGSNDIQSASRTVDARPTSCLCSTDSACDSASQQRLEQPHKECRGGATATAADSQQEQHVEAVVDPPSPDSSSQPPAFSSKTENQLRWEELHQKPADSSNKQQDESAIPAQQDATDQPLATSRAAAPAAASKAAAPLLRPRLSSRRVCSSDFV